MTILTLPFRTLSSISILIADSDDDSVPIQDYPILDYHSSSASVVLMFGAS
uniref:Uncharacterized protein n=1 Tax=Picea sitchensis TaxID=3332 RepID=A0A6B9XSY4_PICSI|nr:hypothetical protein Q903MT_gene6633 [Picea sitchensis]